MALVGWDAVPWKQLGAQLPNVLPRRGVLVYTHEEELLLLMLLCRGTWSVILSKALVFYLILMPYRGYKPCFKEACSFMGKFHVYGSQGKCTFKLKGLWQQPLDFYFFLTALGFVTPRKQSHPRHST